MVSNNILAFSVGLLGFSLCRGMHIKATIVAYAFSVQCFENATIVTYMGLRVKLNVHDTLASKHSIIPPNAISDHLAIFQNFSGGAYPRLLALVSYVR